MNSLDTLANVTAQVASSEGGRLLGVKLINLQDLLALLMRFSLNLGVVLFLVGVLYYRRGGRKEYFFTHVMLSTVVFLLCFLLESVKLELGFALGLFAVFGIIRYRTESIPIKEMSYLFAVIGVSIMNALSNKKVSYAELAFANLALLGTVAALEVWFMGRAEQSHKVLYERIDLVAPERRAELMADLRLRTGLEVVRVEVGDISFLRDTAELTVFYRKTKAVKSEA
jgi:hypothetical protein